MRIFYPLLVMLLVSSASLAQGQEGISSHQEKADISKTITIYPNPATDFVNIKLSTLDATKTKITLFNILGNEIEIESEVVDAHEVRVRVKDLATGYYLLAVREEQSQFRGTYKFLKR